MKARFLTIISITLLLLSQNTHPIEAQGNWAKYKKQIVIGANTVLCGYSLEKIISSLFTSINLTTSRRYRRLKKRAFLADLINTLRIPIYGFLAYFSAKNVIQELQENPETEKEIAQDSSQAM